MKYLLGLLLVWTLWNDNVFFVSAINFPRPLSVMAIPTKAMASIFQKLFGRRKSAKHPPEKTEEQKLQIRIENLQENLRDLSIAYDVMRDQMMSLKTLNTLQKSDFHKAKKENDIIRRKFTAEIEKLKENFAEERQEMYKTSVANLQRETSALRYELTRAFTDEKNDIIREHKKEIASLKSELQSQTSSTSEELEEVITKLKLEKEKSRAKDKLIAELEASQTQSSKEITELKKSLREIAGELQRVQQQQQQRSVGNSDRRMKTSDISGTPSSSTASPAVASANKKPHSSSSSSSASRKASSNKSNIGSPKGR